MQHSESIDKLAAAMAKAQATVQKAHKNQENPYFKSDYADLASTWDACREPLSENGIAIVQMPSTSEGEVCMTTILMHSSGQWLRESITCRPGKNDAQSIGAVCTYLRRYALQAAAGVAPADDDAETEKKLTPTQKKKNGTWRGPLQVTALKNKMRDFKNALDAAETRGQMDAVMEEYAAVLEQCADDLPDWWEGGDDIAGAQAHIKQKLRELPPDEDEPDVSDYLVPVPPMENGDGSNWPAWREKLESMIDGAGTLELVNEIAAANKSAFVNYTKAQPRNAASLKQVIDKKRGFFAAPPEDME